ncbi:MAG: T9SS type A sorting domain-containing protein [Bacteroidales bacterium]|nr:T9SS type A sorting domain-containing protein [Bacteroidales bacterium]
MRRFCLLLASLFATLLAHSQYINKVLEYKPGPGQFVNSSAWGQPETAKSIIGGIMGHLTLGAFGGYVVFKFENPVENHEDNPYGVDFIVYGNPLKNIANPQIDNLVTWSEPGIVSVMKDENGNGLPDDTWYELAGSDYHFSSTVNNYSVTYTNPKKDVATDVPWKDNMGNSGAVLANKFYSQPYYPDTDMFSDVGEDNYILSGSMVKDYVDKSNPSYVTCFGRPWGYADNTLRGTFNGLPDNPYTRNVVENSGGDSFDISWAVNKDGEYVDLNRIDFVKVHTGTLADAGWLGEVSTEVAGAYDVAPDKSVKGELYNIVVKELPATIEKNKFNIESFVFYKGRVVTDKDIIWETDNSSVVVENGKLVAKQTVDADIKATIKLKDNQDVKVTVSTHINVTVDKTQQPTDVYSYRYRKATVYPNPSCSVIYIDVDKSSVSIIDLSGRVIKNISEYNRDQPINISSLPNGIYLVKINCDNVIWSEKFIKR